MTEIAATLTTSYDTVVDDLPAAWAFVMEHIEKVGPDPDVRISPRVVLFEVVGEDSPRQFSVSVSGTVEVEG